MVLSVSFLFFHTCGLGNVVKPEYDADTCLLSPEEILLQSQTKVVVFNHHICEN
jgi:hypothetical protein